MITPEHGSEVQASETLAFGTSAVTLGMVAHAANVSPSTVSRILNGTARVSEDKKKAVEEAIERLGFRPNPVARGLASGRTLSIGVVTQAIDSPYYGEGLRGIEEVLNQAGYIPLFVSGHWNPDDERRCIDVLLSRRVDGMIVFAGRLDDAPWVEVARQMPVVINGRNLKAPGVFAMNFDNLEGARMATRHLLELGHRRIAHIAGDFDHLDAQERYDGYRQALEEAGVPLDEALVVSGEYHEKGGFTALNRLREAGASFSAVFAANDQMALGAMLALYRHGVRVPHDMSVVGFDDLAASVYALPPLTTVQQPVLNLGRSAAQSMLRLLKGEVPDLSLPPPRLIVRESTRRV